jgi:hypothetical protein
VIPGILAYAVRADWSGPEFLLLRHTCSRHAEAGLDWWIGEEGRTNEQARAPRAAELGALSFRLSLVLASHLTLVGFLVLTCEDRRAASRLQTQHNAKEQADLAFLRI